MSTSLESQRASLGFLLAFNGFFFLIDLRQNFLTQNSWR
jgi:hypothetical protein